MGNNFAHVCKVAGVSGVILFPLAGPVTLKSFVKAAQEEELVPIVGGAMTHKGFFSVENGFISNEDALRIYDLASTLGVSHFVLPGTIPESFPEYIDTITQSCSSPIFLIPGIGTQGGQIEKAFSLLRGYNSYVIIGSAIYKTKDMRKSAQDFANQAISKIQKSFDQTEGEK